MVVLALVACAVHAPLVDLADFVDRAHPAPYRYATPEALGVMVSSELDPVRAVATFTAALGDAHMGVGFGRPPTGLVPVLPWSVGGRVLVDAATVDLPLGTELVAIEGRPIAEVLDEVAAVATVDGDRSEVRAAEAVRRFDRLSNAVMGPRERWRVTITRPGAAPEVLLLDGLDQQAARELQAARRSALTYGPSTPDDAPVLLPLDEETVLLRLPSFGSPDQAAYEARVDELFDTLGGDERLVVDLRGNEGGLRTHGVAVLRHLLAGPFAQWQRVATRIRRIPRRYADRVTFLFGHPEVLRGFDGVRAGRAWVRRGDPLVGRMTPVPEPHRGPVAVLVDDATNSAAVEMVVALLAHRDDVLVVGRPTQGACDRHVGELPVLFEVGQEMFVLMSLFDVVHVEAPGCVPGEGVPLDVVVPLTEADWRAGVDPFLRALAGWGDR